MARAEGRVARCEAIAHIQPMTLPKPKLTPDSAFGYAVELFGTTIGHVGKGDKGWTATLGEFDLGQHQTRREAIEAMMEVYFT